jgi:hypothetical protein
MDRTRAALSASLFALAVVGEGKMERNKVALDSFSRVRVSDAIICDIKLGSPPSATVEAPVSLAQLIKPVVDGDTLVLELARRASYTGTIKVHVVAPKLDAVDASGASEVAVADAQSDAFKLTVSGASKAKVKGHVGAGSLDASGASHVELSGEAADFTIGASGASVVDTTSLTMKKADVDANGASTVDVGPSEELNPTASGASTIHYLGNPKVNGGAPDVSSTIAHG